MPKVDDSFKEQLIIFYFSHMRRVAQSLFDAGSPPGIVAANLLISKPIAQRWQSLHKQGLLFNGEIHNKAKHLTLPFAKLSRKYEWKKYEHKVKRATKIFFDMGLPNRAIAIYLGVPLPTIYFWHNLYRMGRFNIESNSVPWVRAHSYDTRRAVKDCFEKGMALREITLSSGIPWNTIYEWYCQYQEGCFYVSEEEKLAMKNAGKK